jgi:hypothetical protein
MLLFTYIMCQSLFHVKVKRIELAMTHLEAAKYCKEKSAFVEAATLLRWGLALLDEDNNKVD